MSTVTTNLGVVTAYGDAVAAGYTGTKAQWQALMASYATVAQEAQGYAANASTSATNAAASESNASSSATTANNAKTAAQTAQGYAEAAQTAAEDARDDVQASATQIAQNTTDISNLNNHITKITGYTAISFTNGKYIKTNLNVGDTVDLTPVTGYNTNNYAIVDAQAGDTFTINGTGGNAGRLWCFVDSNNVLLSVSDSGAVAENLILTAPANASKLILNPVTGYGLICKGETLPNLASNLRAEVANTRVDLTANLEQADFDTFVFNRIEIGTITNGEDATATTRARSTDKVKVYAGNIVVQKRLPSNGAYNTFRIMYYDSNGAYTSASEWTLMSSAHQFVISTNGYIRVLFNANNTTITDTSVYEDLVTVYYTNTTVADEAVRTNRLPYNPLIREIRIGDYMYGYLRADGSIDSTVTRIVTHSFIPCQKGDFVDFDMQGLLYVMAVYDADKNLLSINPDYIAYPSFITDSNAAYVRIGVSNGTDSINIDDYDGVLRIRKMYGFIQHLSLGVQSRVETSTSADCVQGYLNNGAVASHGNYMAVFRYFPVKKGDAVRVNNTELNMWVSEYDTSGAFVASSGKYIRQISKSPYGADEYIVKNDGFVRAHFANYTSTTRVDISEYGNSLLIVHKQLDTNEQDAYREAKWVTPKAPVKARKIRVNQDIYVQSGTMVGEYLWQATDNYNSTYTLMKVNPETGETIKTVSSDFGHVGSLDYNASKDVLLCKTDAKIILYKNFSQFDSDTINLSDANCIDIDYTTVSISGLVFGEDEYTLYGITMWNGTSRVSKAYKMQLGYDGTDYDGTVTLLKTYTGEVRDDVECRCNGSSVSYVQDIAYNGYLYVGYGTGGFNVLVIDLDDETGSFAVVGNYNWTYHDNSYAVLEGELETVALNADKIIAVYRNYTDEWSVMIEYQR